MVKPEPQLHCNMADEAMLGLPILAGSLILVILFITWYGDPLVSPVFSISLATRADRWGLGIQLNSIPAMGFSDPLLSYLSALYVHVFDGTQLLKEGYEKVTPAQPP